MNESDLQAGKASWLDGPVIGAVLVVAVAAAAVFMQLGQTSLDEHEAKAALAARGMVQTNQWLVQGPIAQELPAPTRLNRWLIPINNGRPRLVKTPLGYWAIAALGEIHGDKINEWVARIPSAVAAVICALVVLGLGRRMLSPRAALLGALIFATSLGLVKWGHSARPEMLMCLFITAAMGSFYAGLTSVSRAGRHGWMIVFWLTLGLANLCKEVFPLLLCVPLAAYLCWRAGRNQQRPRRLLAIYCIASAAAFAAAVIVMRLPKLAWWHAIGLSETVGTLATMGVLTLLPLAWYAVRTRVWGEIRPLLPTAIPGAIVMLAMFLPWMWYMNHLFGAAAVFNEQVAERATGTAGPEKLEPEYYLIALVTMTLPWLGLLPGAFAVAWMKRFDRYREGLVYLFLWSAVLIGLLTVSAGKREHYLLPMLPAISLLMGFVAEDVFFNHRWIGMGLARFIGFAYGVVGLIAPIVVAAIYFLSIDKDLFRKLFKPFRFGQTTPDPATWLHMLIVTLVVAVFMGWALLAAGRRRLSSVFALIVLSMTLTYAGFYLRADIWDRDADAPRFADEARHMVPPGDAVASCGTNPLAKIVYYFGRDIPNINWTRQRLLAEPDGQRQWEQWLKDPRNSRWVFGYEDEVDDLPGRENFEVAYSLLSIETKKKVTYVLLKRKGT